MLPFRWQPESLQQQQWHSSSSSSGRRNGDRAYINKTLWHNCGQEFFQSDICCGWYVLCQTKPRTFLLFMYVSTCKTPHSTISSCSVANDLVSDGSSWLLVGVLMVVGDGGQ